jgi:PPOX class probable F420-dependent enzyme
MPLSESDLRFLQSNQSAAMITVGDDGQPKAVRVGVAVVDGKLWSSGTADRVRTARLRNDPRCTLYVYDAGFSFLTLETTVQILDGPDAPQLSVRLFRQMQGRPTGPLSWFGGELDEDAFAQTMVDEKRVIYELTVERTYGLQT